MGFFSKLNPFKKKEKVEDVDLAATGNIPHEMVPKITGETNIENVKAKMDLVLTQIQSLNVRYETVNSRLERIEQMIQEIYKIAKS
jgi:hypothetical protein